MWVAMVSRAVAAAFPSAGGLRGLDVDDPRPFVRAVLRDAPWLMWIGTVGAALAFELLPVLTIGWPLPAFALPVARRHRHAHAMACHRFYLVRMAMMMIKTVGGLCWGADPGVRAALGLPAYPADPRSHRDRSFRPVADAPT